jgi:hypothetical protein
MMLANNFFCKILSSKFALFFFLLSKRQFIFHCIGAIYIERELREIKNNNKERKAQKAAPIYIKENLYISLNIERKSYVWV